MSRLEQNDPSNTLPSSIRELVQLNSIDKDPLQDANNRMLIVRLILTTLMHLDRLKSTTHERDDYPYLKPKYDCRKSRGLIQMLKLENDFNTLVIRLHDSLNAAQIIALAKLPASTLYYPVIAALQPQVSKALQTLYSSTTVARFMLIQNHHPTAQSLLHRTHPAFCDSIRKDHTKMVRARARRNAQQAGHYGARICCHLTFGQQFYVESSQQKTDWVQERSRKIYTMLQSATYQTWADELANLLITAKILQPIFFTSRVNK